MIEIKKVISSDVIEIYDVENDKAVYIDLKDVPKVIESLKWLICTEINYRKMTITNNEIIKERQNNEQCYSYNG